MFSGVPNGPLRLSPPQVHAAVHNSGAIFGVEGQPAAERVDAADSLPHHRIVGLPVALRITTVGRWQIHWVTLEQPKQRATRLNR